MITLIYPETLTHDIDLICKIKQNLKQDCIILDGREYKCTSDDTQVQMKQLKGD